MPDPEIIARHEVAPGQLTIAAKEPCAAVFDDVVFCTDNVNFVRMSVDRGVTFPSALTRVSSSVFGGAKCGDQSTMWIPGIETLVWVMLAQGSENRMRLAMTRPRGGTTFPSWQFFELGASDLELSGMNFDYPQLALGQGMLYITLMFSSLKTPELGIVGAVIIRIALDQLTQEGPSTYNFQYFTSQDVKQFCAAQDVAETGFWAGHLSNSALRHYSWNERSNNIEHSDIQIPAFNDTAPYSSRTPDGEDWLGPLFEGNPPKPKGGLDHRITGGAVASSSDTSDDLVYAWTAGPSPPKRPEPYIYLAALRFDRRDRTTQLLDTRDIFNHEHAWAFPALGGLPSAPRGLLAMSCAWGGGKRFFANQAVGFVDLPITNRSGFRNLIIAESTTGAPRWGDFVCVRHSDPLEKIFVTAGFSVIAPLPGKSPTSSVYAVRFAPRSL